MIDKKSFKKAIARPLEAARLVRKGQSWYLNGRDAIVVLNLQKSDWANKYFINVGIWLRALGESEYPDENDCHLSHRLERLFPEKQKLISEGASLEHDNLQLLQSLSQFIETEVVPFLQECTDNSNLRKFMISGRFKSGFVMKDARMYLSKR